ncbi:probable inactive serine/threonine-protein kinase slob2 [Patiria miniata]|uniref:Uncharacterized protein n=1 Tax=Patiria miniata TaxID=46514 RepID=A0A913ZHY8_PATMI|nr:probable inactive serine/threonine-protein kinase slob2 [Patiria miniata]
MTDIDNAAGIYLPPGADETDKKTSEFLALDEEEDKDLLNIEDDLDQLLSDVIKKPDKAPQKPSLKPKPPSPTKKPIPAQRPTPAPRSTGGPGKAPPKPAPRKGKTPSTGGSQSEETGQKAETVDTMDDGDILKYIQQNAGDEEASLDLF